MHAKSLDLSAARVTAIILISLGLFALVGMGVDLIAPSLPAIAKDLHTTASFPQTLISIYLLGYALICIFIGFLSDAWGRRNLLILALFVYLIGSLLPLIFPNKPGLLIARFLQGLGVGGITTLVRAVLSDLLPRERLMSVGALLATLWSVGTIVAPIIGGYLQFYFNWSAGFYFFAAFSLMALIAVMVTVPETMHDRKALRFKQIRSNFKTVLSNSFFVGLLIMTGISYSVLIVFGILGPFFIQKNLGYSPIFFGHAGLALGVAFLVGTLACRYLIKRVKLESIVSSVIVLAFIAAIVQLILSYVYGSSPWVVIIPTGVLFFSSGVIYPTLTARAMTVFREYPHLSGTANSMLVLTLTLITALISVIMSLMHHTSAISISWAYVGLILFSGVTYYSLVANSDKTK